MKHTISILVENHAGVLARVAGLFARRGFNIDSLAVGVTEDEKISRITIIADGTAYTLGADRKTAQQADRRYKSTSSACGGAFIKRACTYKGRLPAVTEG